MNEKKTIIKRHPSPKQMLLAEAIVENSKRRIPLSYNKLLQSVGYRGGNSVVTNTLRKSGLKKALKDLGFTVKNAKKVVAKIMLDEDADAQARLKATDQVFKVHGEYAPEKHDNRNVNVNLEPSFTDDEIAKIKAGVRAKQLNLPSESSQ